MRLAALNHKFEKNPDLKKEYDKVLMSYEQDSIIVEVPFSELESPYPTHMPHRPVIKDSISSKVRPVFDASAKGPNGSSLNDCVESGPSLIPDLVEVVLRFKRWNIDLTADIVKAFLQIGVQRPDQDHKFLKHADVHTLMSTIRNSYWIIGLRRLAKRACKECVACRRFDSRPYNQPPPPLPELRVNNTFPFAEFGSSYGGEYVKNISVAIESSRCVNLWNKDAVTIDSRRLTDTQFPDNVD
ncbi:uncharacterized protein [Macrobrachium rosenbergii]|uniref:uncharacterized protein n=1 Tax=Macrobrachium rosenbergii TaxID=79674 RepID=UPI0034D5CFE7